MKFRRHCGGLAESMATVEDVQNAGDIAAILNRFPYGPLIRAEQIEVTPYARDERIGWDTHIVTVDGSAVGFTDGPLPDVPAENNSHG